MGEPATKYWFRAKRYGWGWGLPSSWQGWVFMLAWIAALLASTPVLRSRPLWLYALFGIGMVAILLAVCLAKGEPPAWRWGDRGPPRTSVRGDVRDRQG
jgi:hypothetical protein